MRIKTIGIVIAACIICCCSAAWASTYTLEPSLAATVAEGKTYPANDAINLVGKPYEEYSRGLLRFDLRKLTPMKFGGVTKATLRVVADNVSNPADLPVELAPLNVSWTSKATYGSPDGDKASWPTDANRTPHIDMALDSTYSTNAKPAPNHPNVLEWDVTRIVDAWLYQGYANNGILLRIGKTVFGRPDAGSWLVSIPHAAESVQLIVELDGKPASRGDIGKRTLRCYPSALTPPVKQPYIFMWLFAPMPSFPGAVANTTLGNIESDAQTGILPMQWFYGPNNKWIDSRKGFENAYRDAAKLKGRFALFIDEWQKTGDAPDYAIEGSIDGAIAAKKINPSLYTVLCWRGEENFQRMIDAGQPDLVMIEAYSHMKNIWPKDWALNPSDIEVRANTIRKLGLIDRTIPTLGMILKKEDYYPDAVWTADQIEQEIIAWRKIAPEMPGMGMYDNGDPVLGEAADRLMRKHFVEPAPEVSISNPKFEEELSTAHVEFRTSAKGKDGREVKSYRWFVDNRWVAETNSPDLIWDIRELNPGLHFVTVHAIDSAWNRAAAQMPFHVARSKGR